MVITSKNVLCTLYFSDDRDLSEGSAFCFNLHGQSGDIIIIVVLKVELRKMEWMMGG